MNAFTMGLNYDLNALITRNAAIDAARADRLKVDLTVLWQEWQVVQQARLLFVKSRVRRKMRPILQSYQAFFADQYRRTPKGPEKWGPDYGNSRCRSYSLAGERPPHV